MTHSVKLGGTEVWLAEKRLDGGLSALAQSASPSSRSIGLSDFKLARDQFARRHRRTFRKVFRAEDLN